MRLQFQVLVFCLASTVSSAHADEMSTLGRLSDIVESQCRRFYGVDTAAPMETLKQKPINAVDKLACAYPYAYKRMQARLKTLERLDPVSAWGKDAYATLAARIYNFNYLTDTPHGDLKLEIMGVHPDLLILHRILRQLTPYALAFAYPKLERKNADLPMAARIAAAGAQELTPWSALLRQASGTDCYGPEQSKCLRNKGEALQILLNAIQILSKNENLHGYVTQYSQTREATELRSASAIRMAIDLQNSTSGMPIDYILSPRTAVGWWTVRPDVRDTLNYLSASDQDLQASVNQIINLNPIDCHLVFGSLFALANEDASNSVRQAMRSQNLFESVVAANPGLQSDPLKLQGILNQHDCAELAPLSIELSLLGILSRFQAYQMHVLLLSSHDDGLADISLKAGSRRYVLISDIERVIREVRNRASAAGVIVKPTSSRVPQNLVDYITTLLKEGQR